jgi:ankyrin repeat protein
MVAAERSALMFACEQHECCSALQLLIKWGADVCYQSPATGNSALHIAASKCSVVKCELLLDVPNAGPALELRDCDGMTPLAAAALKGLLAVIKCLQSRGADIHTTTTTGETLLHCAARSTCVDTMAYLVSCGLDVSVLADGVTALQRAAREGSVGAVQFILDHSSKPLAQDEDTYNALNSAVLSGSADVVNLLLDSGIPVDPEPFTHMSALMCAAIFKHVPVAIAQQLIDRGATVSYVHAARQGALYMAAAYNRPDVVWLLLRQSLTSGSFYDSFNTVGAALCVAARSGFAQCVKVLLSTDVNAATVYSNSLTCLQAATVSDSGAVETVKLLLAHGAAASINSMSAMQCGCCGSGTALMMSQQPAVTKLLLAAGADVHTANSEGNTCLHVAAAHSYSAPVLCLLIKAGADLSAVNRDNRTAADVARTNGNTLGESLLVRAARDAPPILAID